MPDQTASSSAYIRSMSAVSAAKSGTARLPSTARLIRLLLCWARDLNCVKVICRDPPSAPTSPVRASAMRGSSGRSPARSSRLSTSSGEIRPPESGLNESNSLR